MGPPLLGGLTLVRLGNSSINPALPIVGGAAHTACEVLKQAGFKGLFHFDVEEAADTGELCLRGLEAGWPWLHAQAFLAELESLSTVLGLGASEGASEASECASEGREGAFEGRPALAKRFVTVLPVSVPPWPNEKSTALQVGLPIKGLTPQQQGQCFWFDIQVDQQAKQLRTAGLDGLLAVAVGSSDSTPSLARARALELAHRLEVPGKQWRADVGAQVDAALATLEDRWGFSAL